MATTITRPQLVDDLDAGRLTIVDLTQPLGPDTPVIGLPPIFAPSPGVTIETISRYDDKGPAWYWNTLRFGEHTGTHFDAPIHWITGKDLPDNACDTIPARRFVGPACVIDVEQRGRREPGFPAHARADRASGKRTHGRIPAGAWVLLRTGWSRRHGCGGVPQRRRGRPAQPGLRRRARRGCSRTSATCSASASRRSAPTPARPARSIRRFPNHTIMHGAGKFGLASLCNLDQLPPTGAVVIAAPLKIVNGSGSPLRVLAIAPA